MTSQPQKQTVISGFDGMVDERHATKEYWRDRYRSVFVRFKSFVEMADAMAELDPVVYKGAAGVVKLQRFHAGRGKLPAIAKLVRQLEELRPAKTLEKSSLTRQKINLD